MHPTQFTVTFACTPNPGTQYPGTPYPGMMPMQTPQMYPQMPAQPMMGMGMSTQPMMNMSMPMMPMPAQPMMNMGPSMPAMMQQMINMQSMMMQQMMAYPQGIPAHPHPHTPQGPVPQDPMYPFTFALGMPQSQARPQYQHRHQNRHQPRSYPTQNPGQSFTSFEELADALTRAAGMPTHQGRTNPNSNSNSNSNSNPRSRPTSAHNHHVCRRHGGPRPNQGTPDQTSMTSTESLQQLMQLLTVSEDSTMTLDIECGSLEEAIGHILTAALQPTMPTREPVTNPTSTPAPIPKSNVQTRCMNKGTATTEPTVTTERYTINASDIMANPELIESYPTPVKEFLHKFLGSIKSREENTNGNEDCDDESEGETFSMTTPSPTSSAHRWQSVTPTPPPKPAPAPGPAPTPAADCKPTPGTGPEPVSEPESTLTPPRIDDMDYLELMALETVVPGAVDAIAPDSEPAPTTDETEIDYESDEDGKITDEPTD